MAALKASKPGDNLVIPAKIPHYRFIDKKMRDSLKRRIKITEKIIEMKDIILLFRGGVLGGWVSYFSVDDAKIDNYRLWLIALSVIGFIALVIVIRIRLIKKEFVSTIVTDMEEIEEDCDVNELI